MLYVAMGKKNDDNGHVKVKVKPCNVLMYLQFTLQFWEDCGSTALFQSTIALRMTMKLGYLS